MPARVPGWNAGRMIFALATHFPWWEHKLVTELEIDGGRADLVLVSKAGYATEIEIKVSRGDWRNDRDKLKWMAHGWTRPHVSRFFYAVPEQLANQIPVWVPKDAGILVVRAGSGRDHVREQRAARRFAARKLSDAQLTQIERAFYYRFWRQHMEVLGGRFVRPEARAA